MSLKLLEEMIFRKKGKLSLFFQKGDKFYPLFAISREKVFLKGAALILAASLFCGCADISQREFIYIDPSESSTDGMGDGVGGDLLIVTTDGEKTEEEETNKPPLDEPFTLSQTQQDFLNSCYFMGDSICLGLGINGFVENCSAKAGVAARNIEEFTFTVQNSQVPALTALVNSNLKRFVFLMGSNDVNVESEDEYIKYYRSFLLKVAALCPDADIYVLSIPPVAETSTFCYNYQIDAFNLKLKEMVADSDNKKWHYMDIASYMKNEQGDLIAEYASDSTVHLTLAAYRVFLAAFCREVGVE